MKNIFVKRLIALVLFIAPMLLQAQTNPAYSGGSGTSADPFLISTDTDLTALAEASIGAADYTQNLHFKQTQDIIFTAAHSNFPGIGGRELLDDGNVVLKPFLGTYDGSGFIIKGLQVEQARIGVGFFNFIGQGAVVKNMVFEGNSIAGLDITATIVAVNMGGLVTDCVVKSNNSVMSMRMCVSGVVGSNSDGGIVQRCTNAANITGFGEEAIGFGGIVGDNSATVVDCANWGTINAGGSAGGIVGILRANGTVERCYNGGNIKATSANQPAMGGIVGASNLMENPSSMFIKRCYNYGKLINHIATTPRMQGPINGQNLSNNPNLSITMEHCYYDNQTSGADEPDAEGLSTEQMKSDVLLNKINEGAAGAFVSDAEQINSGYPVLSWQSSTPQMVLFANEFTLEVGKSAGMPAILVPETEGKKAWAYKSDNPEIVTGGKKTFKAEALGNATVTLQMGTVKENTLDDLDVVLAEADFVVNVVDNFTIPFVNHADNWELDFSGIKAMEEARGNVLFTQEYIDNIGAMNEGFEVFKTNDALFPFIIYAFNPQNHKVQDVYTLCSVYAYVLGEGCPYTDHLRELGFQYKGTSTLTGGYSYFHETTETFVTTTLLKVQGGVYVAINHSYDPGAVQANQVEGTSIDLYTADVAPEVVAINREIVVSLSDKLYGSAVGVYNTQGQIVALIKEVNNSQQIRVPVQHSGIYFVKATKANRAVKVLVK